MFPLSDFVLIRNLSETDCVTPTDGTRQTATIIPLEIFKNSSRFLSEKGVMPFGVMIHNQFEDRRDLVLDCRDLWCDWA